MIFLRRHLHEGLKAEYLTVKDSLVLWNSLKERYEHQRTVILPKARYDWMHLRLQDFKSVSEYNSAIFRISSQLQLCGEKITDEDMLEKTFSTFHASNVLLHQQYREKGFRKYSELISCLLVAEQNNEILMKNHEARPTGPAPFPEVNATTLIMDKVEVTVMVVVAVIVGVVDVDEDVVAIVTITIGNPRMCQNIKRGRILKRTTKVVKIAKL